MEQFIYLWKSYFHHINAQYSRFEIELASMLYFLDVES